MRGSLFLSALLVTTLVGGSALADRSNRDRDRHKESVKEAAFKQRGEYFEQFDKPQTQKPKVTRDYDKTRAHRENKGAPGKVENKLQQVGRFEDDPSPQGSNKKRQSSEGYSDKTMAKREAMKAQAVEGMRAYKSMDKGPMLDAARRGFDEETGSSGKASNKKQQKQAEEKTWSDKTMQKRLEMKAEALAGMIVHKQMDKGPELVSSKEGTNGGASSSEAPDKAPQKAQKQTEEKEAKESPSSRSADW